MTIPHHDPYQCVDVGGLPDKEQQGGVCPVVEGGGHVEARQLHVGKHLQVLFVHIHGGHHDAGADL